MIILAFTLSGLVLLAFQVSTMDLILWIKRLSQEFDQDLGHDAKVFPDFTP